MEKEVMYGIWNSMRKEFQFGICEPSKAKAIDKLFKKIGNDARKWRFEVKRLPNQPRKGDANSGKEQKQVTCNKTEV